MRLNTSLKGGDRAHTAGAGCAWECCWERPPFWLCGLEKRAYPGLGDRSIGAARMHSRGGRVGARRPRGRSGPIAYRAVEPRLARSGGAPCTQSSSPPATPYTQASRTPQSPRGPQTVTPCWPAREAAGRITDQLRNTGGPHRQGRHASPPPPRQMRARSLCTHMFAEQPESRRRGTTVGILFHREAPRAGAKQERAGSVYSKTPPLHPHRGRRIGEATNPGPTDVTRHRRHRALHALAQMGLLQPGEAPAMASDAETLSDTLSQQTPFASPRELEREASPTLGGEAAPTAPGDATPGFTPPASPASLPAPARAPLIWEDARPPATR